jgi:hypothetical protein
MTNLKAVLNSAEVAEMLDCAIDTIDQKASSRVLPGIKYGRGWVFPAEALVKVLNEQALASMDRPAHSSAMLPLAQTVLPPQRIKASRRDVPYIAPYSSSLAAKSSPRNEA